LLRDSEKEWESASTQLFFDFKDGRLRYTQIIPVLPNVFLDSERSHIAI
jgi:hypothetical protein